MVKIFITTRPLKFEKLAEPESLVEKTNKKPIENKNKTLVLLTPPSGQKSELQQRLMTESHVSKPLMTESQVYDVNFKTLDDGIASLRCQLQKA